MARIARALALYRGLVAPLWARPFCALRGPRRGVPLGAAAPGGRSALVRSGAVKRPLWLPPAAASSLCPVAFSVLPSLAPRLRPRVPLSVAASAALPPPALCSIVGRPAPGLRAPRGAGVFSLPGLLVGLRTSPFPRFWFPPPSVARFLSPVGGRRLRRRSFSYSDGVDLAASAEGCKDRAGIRCLLGSSLVPCPSSCRYENLKTAIDIQSVLLYH